MRSASSTNAFAMRRQRTAEQFNQLPADRQAQSKPSVSARSRLASLFKWLEDGFFRVFVESAAGVVDFHDCVYVISLQANSDHSPRLAEFDRVR